MSIIYFYADDSESEEYQEDKTLHRTDGPAIICDTDDLFYFEELEIQGPAEIWFHNGEIHRPDGPAVEEADLHIWYQKGQLHNDHGPAKVHLYGEYRQWWVNDKLHREDGPAIEKNINSSKGPRIHREWYLEGKKISQKKYFEWYQNKNGNLDLFLKDTDNELVEATKLFLRIEIKDDEESESQEISLAAS